MLKGGLDLVGLGDAGIREFVFEPARVEGLLVAETSRFRGVVPSPFEGPAIFLGDGEGAVRAVFATLGASPSLVPPFSNSASTPSTHFRLRTLLSISSKFASAPAATSLSFW